MAGAQQPHYLVLYGSLKRGFPNRAKLGIEDSIQYEGPCAFKGTLFDLGDYPGACPGGGIVRGELYRILDPDVLRVLDPFEHFDPASPDHSLYLRQCVNLLQPQIDAWVYFLRERPSAPVVRLGFWTHPGVGQRTLTPPSGDATQGKATSGST